MRYVLMFMLTAMAGAVWAQADNVRNEAGAATSLDPAPARQAFSEPVYRKQKKVDRDGSHIETHDEYVARMKRTVRMIRKQEKLMKKPQYSNPMYFGHKRPPKKHKPSKMRYCRECGIRH